MRIMDILVRDAVILDVVADNKDEVLGQMAQALAAAVPAVDADRLIEVLREREALQSTGIGEGVAIPHGKSEFVKELGGVLGIKSEGVEFDSLDGHPTYIFFLLVSPMDVSGPHIKALARISRLLKGKDFRKELIACPDKETAIRILEEAESNH